MLQCHTTYFELWNISSFNRTQVILGRLDHVKLERYLSRFMINLFLGHLMEGFLWYHPWMDIALSLDLKRVNWVSQSNMIQLNI